MSWGGFKAKGVQGVSSPLPRSHFSLYEMQSCYPPICIFVNYILPCIRNESSQVTRITTPLFNTHATMKKPYPLDNEGLAGNPPEHRLARAVYGFRHPERRAAQQRRRLVGGCRLSQTKKPRASTCRKKAFMIFSSRESGGVIELTQKILTQRLGRIVNCYEAGKWLVGSRIEPLWRAEGRKFGQSTKAEA